MLIGVAATAALLTAPVNASAEPRADHITLDQPTAADLIDDTNDAPDQLFDRCPLDGASTFEDSWGWARSGGRSHEGVDMIADRGTPIVAVRDGDVLFKQNRLGGNAMWLTAPNGDKFYYAHLDAFEGESRAVQAGDLIGYVGSSGNAQGPHLHFETLPGGGVENPFPHTLGACVPSADDLARMAADEANVLDEPTARDPLVPTP